VPPSSTQPAPENTTVGDHVGIPAAVRFIFLSTSFSFVWFLLSLGIHLFSGVVVIEQVGKTTGWFYACFLVNVRRGESMRDRGRSRCLVRLFFFSFVDIGNGGWGNLM